MSSLFGEYEYSVESNKDSVQKLIDVALSKSPQSLMILCCDNDLENRDFFDSILLSLKIPVFGGIFPAFIIGSKLVDKGTLLVPVNTSLELKVFHNLENAQANSFDFSCDLPDYRSAMILIDGLSRNVDFALNQVFQKFGHDLKVFGGGAGSLSFEQKPCLFSNQGLLMDAMVVVFMQLTWRLAIGHGWEVLEGPFLANEVDDNKILQLNFQPAFEVYGKAIESFDGRSFEEYDFFELAKMYPFGLERLDDELLVREAVSVEQGCLVCVGKVPENTMLYILKGQNTNLINAAVQAVKNTVTEDFCAQGFIFDCVGRQLCLGSEFSDELEGISENFQSSELIGVLALGEIASGISGAIHLHNKTAVVAVSSDNIMLTKE